VPGGLLTDLYELNMASSYLRRSLTGPATFSLFVRVLPAGRQLVPVRISEQLKPSRTG
jgi:nicotinate phosphoribosyltransferase